MSDIRNGGAAFPTLTYDQGAAMNGIGVSVTDHPGMPLRDYFAARAMQADLSNWPEDASDWLKYRDDLARRYYLMADAMLKARETSDG